MADDAMCGSCFDGMHSCCTGTGCYCQTCNDPDLDDPELDEDDDEDYCSMCGDERPCDCDDQLRDDDAPEDWDEPEEYAVG